MKSKLLIIFVSLFLCITTYAQKLMLNEMFNEGVVLQQNSNVLVWGKAGASEAVSVSIQGKTYKSESDEEGKWIVTLQSLKAGGPYRLKAFTEKDSVVLKQVYVGEVWIAAGQSNMGWVLEKSNGGKEEIANATNKNIRFLMVPVLTYKGDKTKGDMNWRTATTENVAPMSGVAYFFAKELQAKLNVPVGIICCYKGGTSAEVWMSRERLLNVPDHASIVESYENYMKNLGQQKYNELYNKYELDFKLYSDSMKAGYSNAIHPIEPMGDRHYKRPNVLYDFMQKRIIPYTVRGVIWYQGEANAQRAEQYRTLFPALIQEYRDDFKNQELPFLFVQLANYDHPAYGSQPIWAELREAQLLTWQKVKNTAMVVTMDVGEKNTIHPTNKKPVGERLAACAFYNVYGLNNPYSGPIYKDEKFNGDKAIVSFDFVYDGLSVDGQVKGFAICGKDKVFVPAEAKIENNKVIVSSELVKEPIAVRYSWANWSDGNLKNKNGFPASPFRTDNFELLTKGVKAPIY